MRSFIECRREEQTIFSYKELTACVDIKLEQADHEVARFVGGSMENLYHSPQDWVFFLHAANIDRLWTEFRRRHTEEPAATRYNPDYDACTKYHTATTIMRPFDPMSNLEAFNANDVYESIYEYKPVPECSSFDETLQRDVFCGDNPYLFCHTTLQRCVSRVHRGGMCRSMESEQPCIGVDVCLGGYCQYTGIGNNTVSGNTNNKPDKQPPVLVSSNDPVVAASTEPDILEKEAPPEGKVSFFAFLLVFFHTQLGDFHSWRSGDND